MKGDVELIMKTILDTKPWLSDPSLVPVPWNPTPSLPTRLKVGYFTSDGVVTPQPPIARAMKAALDALREREDVELVPFEPYRHRDANKLVVSRPPGLRTFDLDADDVSTSLQHRLYFPDGGKRMRDLAALSGETILPLSQWVLDQGDPEAYDLHGLWEVRLVLSWTMHDRET